MQLSAMKFVQRVILVHTRGVSDPRVIFCFHDISNNITECVCFQLQNKNDPNLSFCPADHPFIPVAKLETEGQKLLEGIMTTLYSSQ